MINLICAGRGSPKITKKHPHLSFFNFETSTCRVPLVTFQECRGIQLTALHDSGDATTRYTGAREATAFAKAIAPYNIVAIVHGHTHACVFYNWNVTVSIIIRMCTPAYPLINVKIIICTNEFTAGKARQRWCNAMVLQNALSRVVRYLCLLCYTDTS